jgi:hypothetical protein
VSPGSGYRRIVEARFSRHSASREEEIGQRLLVEAGEHVRVDAWLFAQRAHHRFDVREPEFPRDVDPRQQENGPVLRSHHNRRDLHSPAAYASYLV